MEKKGIVCFDIGGTGVKYGLFDPETDELLDRGKFATTVEDGAKVLSNMDEVVSHYAKEVTLAGISFSSPGSVKDGVILSGNIIDGFNGLDLAGRFEKRFHVPVAAENDANSAALAEYLLGAAKGYQDVAVVTLGTGVGGGLILDGKLRAGSHTLGGEFGFMFTHGLGDGLPEENILSDHASTRALQNRASAAAGRKLAGPVIFELAAQGDPAAAAALDDFYTAVAMGIYNICYTVDPEIVLIGGAVSQQADLIDEVKKHLSALKPSFSVDLTDLVKIDRCKYLNDAGLVGSYCSFKSSKMK